jgi:hypothetical protein
MTYRKPSFIAAMLAGSVLTASGAFAAATPQTAAEKNAKAEGAAVDKDFRRISNDGATGYQDLILTRLAIFDGKIKVAKEYIEKSDAAFMKAKTDETVFTKAEADFKPPAAKPAPVPADAAATAATKTAIAWLPVDGQMVIGEDFQADPKKVTAVAEANKSLKAGDRAAALGKLKLADIDIGFTIAVVPLEQTITNVHQANVLIGEGKYYEASQMLRNVEVAERFDSANIDGTPTAK